ncbi:hypothetical protein SISSUDRAFT_995179, partial [Sistotremastrum suecicum HHB10207 ss-3]
MQPNQPANGFNGRRGRTLRNPGIICHNCKRNGHIAANCWAPGGGAEGQGPR